jgi:hypothetical protein
MNGYPMLHGKGPTRVEVMTALAFMGKAGRPILSEPALQVGKMAKGML